MGRRKRAWLTGGTGKRTEGLKTLSGYCVEWNDPRTNSHRRRTFRKLKNAREFLKQQNEAFDRIGLVDQPGPSIEVAIFEFMTSCKRLALSTQQDYQTALDSMTDFINPTLYVSNITHKHIDTWLGKAKDERKKYKHWQNARQRSESTIAKYYRNARRFFRWCVQQDYIDRDPTARIAVKPKSTSKNLPVIPTDKQIKTLIDAIDDKGIKLAAVLGITLGWDRGVIASLTADNFDFDKKVVVCRRQKTARSNPVIIYAPIHKSLLSPLRQFFASTAGRSENPPFHQYRLRAWYKNARNSAGHPWTVLNISDFRKIASQRLQSVLPLAQVSKILGHSSTKTTEKHYTILDPSISQGVDKLYLPPIRKARKSSKRKRASA